MASLNSLKRIGERKQKRVGRGQSSGKGKTSGRGIKGQNARAGRKKRPELRDIIKKLPKRRGYGKNRGRTVIGGKPDAVAITLAKIESSFDAGTMITPKLLAEAGMVKGRGAKFPPVKIVGTGDLSKKYSFSGVGVSASARSTIEKAGGTVTSAEAKRTK